MEERSFLQQVVDQTRSETNASENETYTGSTISEHGSDTLPTISDNSTDSSDNNEEHKETPKTAEQKRALRRNSRKTKRDRKVSKDKLRQRPVQGQSNTRQRQSNTRQYPDSRHFKVKPTAKGSKRDGSSPKRVKHVSVSESKPTAGTSKPVSRSHSKRAGSNGQRKSSPLQIMPHSASRQSKDTSTKRMTNRLKMEPNRSKMDPKRYKMDEQNGLSPDAVSASNRMLQSVASKVSTDKGFVSTTTSKHTTRSAHSAKEEPMKTEVEIALEKQKIRERYKTALQILTKSFYSLERCEKKLYYFMSSVSKSKHKSSPTRKTRETNVTTDKCRLKEKVKVPKGFDMYAEKPKPRPRSVSPLPKLLKTGKRSKTPKYSTK